MTTFVVTPARIVFLVVLVGTTLALLTERFRHSRLEARWRSRVKDHIIVAGFGTVGHSAVDTLLAGTTRPGQIVVIDVDADAVTRAREAGLVAIGADATHAAVWEQARVHTAHAVIITCNRDDTATLVTLTVREVNASVPISVNVREAENQRLLSQSGATTVVLSSAAAAGWSGGRRNRRRPSMSSRTSCPSGRGLDLVERPVLSHELGGPPRNEGEVPIGLVRGSVRISFDDAAFQRTAPGDIVVCLVRNRHDEP